MIQEQLCILHFNDVYDIQEQLHEPLGGVARFVYILQQLQNQKKCLTLFSGDIFSPSALSNIYLGEQMLFPIHHFNIDVACPGNHDFDYQLERVEHLLSKSNIPWVLSNVFNSESGLNLAHTLPYYIKETNSIKIGYLGLAEEEWLQQIVEIPQKLIHFEDFLHCAERTIKELRKQCQIIVALTHMRVPNDRLLIESLPIGSIDFVLGGHDHMVYCEKIKETIFLKSGTNFRQLGIISINSSHQGDEQINLSKQFSINNPISGLKYQVECQVIDITAKIPKNIEMEEYVQQKMEEYNKETLKVAFFSDCDLEGRFQMVRNRETNLGNMYADIMKCELGTEIAFFNSGTLRADEVIHQGPLTYQTINKIFALSDLVVTFHISGSDLLRTLENGVIKWPNYDGRFLGVSGISFTFQTTGPPMERIKNVFINGEALNLERKYLAASQSYITNGFDGFIQIQDQDYILDRTAGLSIMQLVLRVIDIPHLEEELQCVELEEGEQKDLDQLGLQEHRVYGFRNIIKQLKKINNHVYVVVNPCVDGRIEQI